MIVPALVAVVVAIVALALRQNRGTTTRTRSSAVAIGGTDRLTIANYAFAPPMLTVKAGSRITVKNTDSTAHTATARSGAFDTGTLKPGQTMSFTLRKPGTYAYYCQFHAFMAGTIKVVK